MVFSFFLSFSSLFYINKEKKKLRTWKEFVIDFRITKWSSSVVLVLISKSPLRSSAVLFYPGLLMDVCWPDVARSCYNIYNFVSRVKKDPVSR